MLRVANCSGFYGDRLSAAREMVEGGPIDFLTGDYLAELTMGLLWKARQRHPEAGYARTFLAQIEEVLGTCLERGIRIVVNAGGLNPAGLAAAVTDAAGRLGLKPVVASVGGDDVMDRMSGLGADAVTANAYLGCWGIAAALDRDAEVVITGRVTDAALAMGPAAHHYGWERDDWDRLAGALVAGHVIECGAQATGGNFSFFTEVPGLDHVGFPVVEIDEDGSFTVTKHPDTGGAVTIETVTAQLLYEITGHRYPNPDVTARFDTIRLTRDGPDRVRVTEARGDPPPPDLKVAVNYFGGYRNRVTFVLTGLDIEAKAAAVEAALWRSLGGREGFAETNVEMTGPFLHVTVKDPDANKVGRRFSNAAVELALASYPGFFLTAPPGDASPYAVYRAASIDPGAVPTVVSLGDLSWTVPSCPPESAPMAEDEQVELPPVAGAELVAAPLGSVAGARSGDKGGDANVGVWVRDPAHFGWLAHEVTVERFRQLLPETADLVVERHVFANLSALNFVVRGLLGEGAAAGTRLDAQAKSLGERLRAGIVDVPAPGVDLGMGGGGGTIPRG